jgi:hypothetical protein
MLEKLGFSKETAMFTRVVDLAALDTGGGVLSWQNPEVNRDIYLTVLDVDVTTKSTGVSTVDAGVSTSATGSDDGIFDGIDTGTAAVKISMKNDTQAVVPFIKVAAGSYVTISKATGAVAGLVGQAIIGYVLAE